MASDGTAYALKWYPKREGDTRDRLGTEFGALHFLAGRGMTEVPRAFAVDKAAGFALYEWIEGTAVTMPGQSDIDAALRFAGQLHALRHSPGADTLPLASEACLASSDIVTQIDRRLRRLIEVARTDSELDRFLGGEFAESYRLVLARVRRGYEARDWRFDAEIPHHARSLSPSDFGFHNAIRCAERRLVFVDFEYFGWDDPVRLAADFVQHPGMSLTPTLAARFRDGALSLYGGDRQFEARLELLQPLIGLRWCMILLNEFLPERWESRARAGTQVDHATAKRLQLEKARARLVAVGKL